MGWVAGLLFVIGVGAYLRLRGLTFQSFWDDELFSAAVSAPTHSLRQVVESTVRDVHPPLFQLLLWLWFKALGFSELTGRLFPALFGIAALPVMYQLGREAVDRRVGLIAALLCAINGFHLTYSQEMRSYSLLFFLGATSLLFYLRLLRSPSRGNAIGFLIATVGMLYTHFFGMFAVAAEAAGIALLWRGMPSLRRPAVIVASVLAVAALPLVPLIIKNAGLHGFWIAEPMTNFAVGYFIEYFGTALMAGIAVLAMLFGLYRYDDERRGRAVPHILLLWLACILILPYIRSVIGEPLLTARNTIVALPAILVLVALGVAAIRDPLARGLLVFAMVTLSAMHIFHEPPYYRSIFKPQIREAAKALIAAHPDADAVFAPEEVVSNFNVYFGLYDAPFRAQSLQRLDELRLNGTAPTHFWIIDGRVGDVLAKPIMHDAALRVVERKDFIKAAFVLMEPAQ